MEIKLGKKDFRIVAILCLVLITSMAMANSYQTLRFADPDDGSIPLAGRTIGHSSLDVVVNLDGGGVAVPCSGDVSLQAAIDSGCIGGGSGSLSNCYWTDWTICSADAMGPTECAAGEVMAGYELVGCSEGSCADVTRCRKYRMECCELSGGSGGSLPDCPVDGQILKYNLGSGSWECADDLEGAGGGAAFGNWQLIGTNIPGGSIYGPAATDGIVTSMAWDGHLQAYTDSTNNPSTMVVWHRLYHSLSGSGVTFPVKKGDYWKVETWGGDGLLDVLYWLPLIEGAGGSGMPDVILEKGLLETLGDSRNAEAYCVALSDASRECHYGAGMDNDTGPEYIYCWCWNT